MMPLLSIFVSTGPKLKRLWVLVVIFDGSFGIDDGVCGWLRCWRILLNLREIVKCGGLWVEEGHSTAVLNGHATQFLKTSEFFYSAGRGIGMGGSSSLPSDRARRSCGCRCCGLQMLRLAIKLAAMLRPMLREQYLRL